MPSLEVQLKALKQQAIAYNTGNFITQDADCLRVLESADKLSHRPESVLITGESGTGKELVAETAQTTWQTTPTNQEHGIAF